MKVFGLTTSTGKVLTCVSPLYPTDQDWIRLVKTRVGPFLKECFPRMRKKTILLDGEGIFHTPGAKAVMRDWGIKALPDWPANSPDLNPEETIAYSLGLCRRIFLLSSPLSLLPHPRSSALLAHATFVRRTNGDGQMARCVKQPHTQRISLVSKNV